jgi:hypothetical protein
MRESTTVGSTSRTVSIAIDHPEDNSVSGVGGSDARASITGRSSRFPDSAGDTAVLLLAVWAITGGVAASLDREVTKPAR